MNVPINAKRLRAEQPPVALTNDPLYRACAVGRSKDRQTAADHDALLYGS